MFAMFSAINSSTTDPIGGGFDARWAMLFRTFVVYITLSIMNFATSYSEMRSAISWYFESKNLALRNAVRLRNPLSVEQQCDLRQYYSQYFVGLVSATELLHEPTYKYSEQFKRELEIAFVFDSFPNGLGNYSYIRELRNSVVHRGLDICSTAHVHEGFVFVVAPPEVSDRNRKKAFPAFGAYLIEVIAKCEQTIGPLIARHMEDVGLLKPLLTQEQALAEANQFLSQCVAVPDWVKHQSTLVLPSIDFVQGQTEAIDRLIKLLNLNALCAADAQPIIPLGLSRQAGEFTR